MRTTEQEMRALLEIVASYIRTMTDTKTVAVEPWMARVFELLARIDNEETF